MSNGTLRIRVVGDSGPFEQTIKGLGGKIGGFAKNVAKVGAGAMVALGGAAVTAAFKTAEMGDEIAKTAPKLGVSTDALQEMRYWADRNGVSSQDLEKAVGRLNTRIGEAADGTGKYADAFESLGVPIKDTNGEIRDTGDVMADSIKALSEIENPSARAAAATELFGQKLGRELMPALEDGSLSMEDAAKMANELGLVMDEDATKAAEKFTDAWADVKESGAAILRDFGTPVMAFLSDQLFPVIIDKVIPALREFGQWLGPKMAAAGEWLSSVFETQILPAIDALAAWWQQNGPAIIAAATELWAQLQTVFGNIVGAVQTVIGWFQSGEGEMNGAMAAIAGFAAEVWPKIQGIISSAIEFVRALIDRVTKIIKGVWERWGSDILKFAAATFENIGKVIGGLLDIIKGIFDAFAALFRGDWSALWDAVKSIASGVWDVISGLFSQLKDTLLLVLTVLRDSIVELWNKLWNKVKELAATALASLISTISTKAAEIVGWFRGLPDRMVRALGNMGSILKGAGRAIMDGLLAGLREKWEDTKDFLSGLGSQIKQLKGPLAYDKVMLRDEGQAIVGGLLSGMESEWGNVESFLRSRTADMPSIAGEQRPELPQQTVQSSETSFTVTQNFYGSDPQMAQDSAMSLKKLAILGAY